MDIITATPTRRLFQSLDPQLGRYQIMELTTLAGEVVRAVFKRLVPPELGKRYSFEGFFKPHQRFGNQYHVSNYKPSFEDPSELPLPEKPTQENDKPEPDHGSGQQQIRNILSMLR